MTLAGMRRQGVFALAAGVVLLIVVPLYRALVLAPAGYLIATTPTTPTTTGGGFGPYLAWAAAHPTIDVGYRVFELIPFALAIGLPGALRRILWPGDSTRGVAATLLGQLGFVAFAGAIAFATVAAPIVAKNYAADPAHRAAIASSYAGLHAVVTLVADSLAAAAIALFLLIVSLRGNATGRLPVWFAYLGMATGGLLGITAVLALLSGAQTDPPTASFAFLALALWFLALGGLLLRVQVRAPADAGTESTATGATAATEPSAPGQ